MEKQILQAAETLFLQQGFAKTTTVQIARLAGCNHALVHYYYRTKEKLFTQILEDKMKLFSSKLADFKWMGETIESKITSLVQTYFDFCAENTALVRFVWMETMTDTERTTGIVKQLLPYIERTLAVINLELKKEEMQGCIRPITAIELMPTIASLTIPMFLMKPFIAQVTESSETVMNSFLEARKTEIIETVLSRIKRQPTNTHSNTAKS